MKHKKLKIFIFIILLFLLILLIFGSCKKTKALEKPIFQGQSFQITTRDINSAFVGIYEITQNSINEIPFQLSWNIQGISNYSYLQLSSYDTNSYRLLYMVGGIGAVSYVQAYKSDALYYYVIVGGNDINNDYELSVQYGFITINKNGSNSAINYINTNYYFDNISQQKQDLDNAYNSLTGVTILPVSTVADAGIYSCYNCFICDFLDYGTTFSEYITDIRDDYLSYYSNNYLSLYISGYNAGYNAGYQLGYDDGYADGETHGYNVGYQAGVNDNAAGQQTAYDHGYSDGTQDGYRTGWDAGYDIGYNDGYATGYGEASGQVLDNGFTVIGSIFGAMGSIMAVNLLPGIPLGLFFLVPLFFAVLGLILWIWRRN